MNLISHILKSIESNAKQYKELGEYYQERATKIRSMNEDELLFNIYFEDENRHIIAESGERTGDWRIVAREMIQKHGTDIRYHGDIWCKSDTFVSLHIPSEWIAACGENLT